MEKLDNTLTRWTVSASGHAIWKGNITDTIFCPGMDNLNANHEEISDLPQMANGKWQKRKKKKKKEREFGLLQTYRCYKRQTGPRIITE